MKICGIGSQEVGRTSLEELKFGHAWLVRVPSAPLPSAIDGAKSMCIQRWQFNTDTGPDKICKTILILQAATYVLQDFSSSASGRYVAVEPDNLHSSGTAPLVIPVISFWSVC